MQTGTKREFAKWAGVNPSSVTKWGDAGKLVYLPDGQIDFEASQKNVFSSHQPQHSARLTSQKNTHADSQASGSSDSYERFNEARAEKEAELAILARLKREEAEGALIRRVDVERDIEKLAAMVVKGLESIPSRVGPLINAEPDLEARKKILESELRNVLTDFSNAAHSLM